jgi:CO/xanthine dehydrogenase Mo-binding subunit/aerobic-type carbon monoxide dehydrogenase small subunit (CoxS/CutS family)
VLQRVATRPCERLSDVLRETLGLTGTKVGCNAGDCGACTVLVDGRQVCACLTAVAQVAGRAVHTVEGLARGDALDRLQRAFLAHGAAQCGICTPGMLMAARDLLARKAHPGEGEVCDALGGVLCRCTGYRKIVEAVLAAADGDVALAAPEPGRAVGARAPKTDGVPRVTGRECYGADRWPDGALWLRVIRSPHAKARFEIGDLGPLRARHPGLVDVITARDVAVNSFGVFPDVKDQPVLADGRVRFRGEAVLCLVGEQQAVLGIGDDEIPVRWTVETPQTEIEQALADTREPVHAANPDNVLIRGRVVKGDAEAALRAAAHVAEGEFTTSFVEHAYIEPEAGYAERLRDEGAGDRIRIYACTQTPYMDRDETARVLGIAPERVHIVPSAVGGGFGGKLDVSVQPLLAVAAWKLGRPVRTVYTRPESMASTTKRHPARMRARFGCDRDGRLVAADFAGDFNTGAYASWGNTVANRVPIHASGPYFVPNVRALTRAVYTNAPVAGAFRGFGVPQSTIVHEALLDELAAKAGIDRLELRYRNAIRAGQATATGQVLKASAGLAQCLDALRPRWQAAVAAAEAFNRSSANGRRRGAGIACMGYGIGNTVIANPSTMRVGLKPAGRIMLYNGAVDIGQGSNTSLLQILADALGLPMSAIDYVMGDTDLTADAGKTSASRQAFVSGNAVRIAGTALRRRMIALAEARPDARLRLEDGALIAADVEGEKRVDLTELPRDARGDALAAEGHFNPPTVPLDANGQGVPYATYGFAAQLAEVEVDLALGLTKPLRIVAAHDVGRAINPTQVEGQIHGGIAQGIGLALMEEYHAGRTENLHDYLIPTFGDVPPIEVILIEEAEPLGPHGAKGVGEPALIPTAPAIFGAIAHATGVRVRHAPATPDRLRAALLAAGATA